MQSDRDKEYMMAMWGTDRLVTDYVYEEKSKFLQEITDYDDKKQNIRNDNDYDDWEYGTEPIPGDHTWANRVYLDAAEKGWDDLMDKPNK